MILKYDANQGYSKYLIYCLRNRLRTIVIIDTVSSVSKELLTTHQQDCCLSANNSIYIFTNSLGNKKGTVTSEISHPQEF